MDLEKEDLHLTELLERAVYLLHSRQVSCVVLKDGEEPYLSSDIGIKPLMIRLREDKKAFEKPRWPIRLWEKLLP